MALTNPKPTENADLPRMEDLPVLPQNIEGNGHSSGPTTKQSSSSQSAKFTKYPAGLIEAYQDLALKRLDECLSADEQARLQSLMNQIDEIDRQDPTFEAMQQHFDKIQAKLDNLRRQIESLPDAE